MNVVWVFLGGGLGSVTRYLIGMLLQKSTVNPPLATLASNVIACIVFASCLLVIENKSESSTLRLLLLTGFCGGLSTFSTFGFETWLLLKQSNYLWAFLNGMISITLCLLAFFIIKK